MNLNVGFITLVTLEKQKMLFYTKLWIVYDILSVDVYNGIIMKTAEVPS